MTKEGLLEGGGGGVVGGKEKFLRLLSFVWFVLV